MSEGLVFLKLGPCTWEWWICSVPDGVSVPSQSLTGGPIVGKRATPFPSPTRRVTNC